MVAMNVWPTDAANGSVADEARWRKMARHWTPTGVCVGVGSELRPTLAFPNLTVRNGAAWVDGHFCELLGDQVLAVTANGLVVVRFDPAANTAELLYRDGVSVPSQSPTGTWEMSVAQLIGSALRDLRTMPGHDPAFRVTTAMNPTNISVLSSGAISLGTVASIPVAVGDYVRADGQCFGTMVGGTTATVMRMAFEASGGGIAYVAQTAPDGEQAMFGGGGGQTQQLGMSLTKVFGPMTEAGMFSAGTRGFTTSAGSGAAMASNRCQLTRIT